MAPNRKSVSDAQNHTPVVRKESRSGSQNVVTRTGHRCHSRSQCVTLMGEGTTCQVAAFPLGGRGVGNVERPARSSYFRVRMMGKRTAHSRLCHLILTFKVHLAFLPQS